MGVAEGGHDLNLPADVNHVLFVLDLILPNGLDGHLETKGTGVVSSVGFCDWDKDTPPRAEKEQ